MRGELVCLEGFAGGLDRLARILAVQVGDFANFCIIFWICNRITIQQVFIESENVRNIPKTLKVLPDAAATQDPLMKDFVSTREGSWN